MSVLPLERIASFVEGQQLAVILEVPDGRIVGLSSAIAAGSF